MRTRRLIEPDDNKIRELVFGPIPTTNEEILKQIHEIDVQIDRLNCKHAVLANEIRKSYPSYQAD